jgi:hypothetical protein
MEVTFKNAVGHDWRIAAEPAPDNVKNDKLQVWLYVTVGPVNVGTFLTREQAVSIGNAFLAAAEISAHDSEAV